jgi:hypothetical protein
VSIQITINPSLRNVIDGEIEVLTIGGPECGWTPGQLPPGSYSQSCEGCSVAASTLSCSGRRINGSDDGLPREGPR